MILLLIATKLLRGGVIKEYNRLIYEDNQIDVVDELLHFF